jgi:hypothetical protein
LVVASMSAPAKTVMARSGRASFCKASATPGRALPAAQPQTELTTTSSVPFDPRMASSTCSGVRVSSTPWRVKSSRMGLMRISEYGMCVLLYLLCPKS